MYKFLFSLFILASFGSSSRSHATFYISYSREDSADETSRAPRRRPITAQETQDVYAVLEYAFKEPVKDLTLEAGEAAAQDSSAAFLAEPVLPDEMMLEVIKKADLKTLASLVQTSHRLAGVVFGARRDIYDIRLDLPFDDELKAHLKLMLGAARRPVYAFLAYRRLSDYLAFIPALNIGLRLTISSKVLPLEHLEKMKTYSERKDDYFPYALWSAYNDAARARLLKLSMLKAGRFKYVPEIRESAANLANLSQGVGMKLGRPHDVADAYIVSEAHTAELIQTAKDLRDKLIDGCGGLTCSVWKPECFMPVNGMPVLYKITLAP